MQLVTGKPFFFIANLHEDENKNTHLSELEDYAAKNNISIIVQKKNILAKLGIVKMIYY